MFCNFISEKKLSLDFSKTYTSDIAASSQTVPFITSRARSALWRHRISLVGERCGGGGNEIHTYLLRSLFIEGCDCCAAEWLNGILFSTEKCFKFLKIVWLMSKNVSVIVGNCTIFFVVGFRRCSSRSVN